MVTRYGNAVGLMADLPLPPPHDNILSGIVTFDPPGIFRSFTKLLVANIYLSSCPYSKDSPSPPVMCIPPYKKHWFQSSVKSYVKKRSFVKFVPNAFCHKHKAWDFGGARGQWIAPTGKCLSPAWTARH